MLLVGNGRLITREIPNTLLNDGCVAIEGETIFEVGKTALLRAKYPNSEYIDACGGVIMPGLINAHNHIYSAFVRGLSIKGYNPKSFLDVLDGQWWTLDRHLTLNDSKMSAMATYLDCIRCGVTTVFDHHASYGGIEGSLFALAEAATEFGVRSCLCYEVSDRDGQAKMRAAVKENVDFIDACAHNSTDMLKGMMGLHASFTLSTRSMLYCRENTPTNVGFHIHVAEGMDDVYDSLKKYNKRVINRLFDLDILGEHTITGHCIHINEQEMDVLKQTDTMVVHNPESNMGNAVGCPPTLEMLRRGILVGLGTDGYTNDMFESVKVANILHKHNLCDPTVAWVEVPQMQYVNNPAIGARFFNKELGVLKAGAAADVIVVDYDPLTPMTAENCNGHLLFGAMGHDVSTTIINGRVRMKHRELVDIDAQKLMADCRQTSSELWKRING